MSGDSTRKTSFAPVVDERCRLLVCGSLPGEASLAARRYYAHPQNQFWRLLSPVVGQGLGAMGYDERLAALRDAGIGLWDVVASAQRVGSGDAAIVEAQANALAELAATLPRLRAIAFNGATAERIGRRALAGAAWPIVALPSSSPLHTVGLAAKQPAWNTLGTWLDE